MALFITGGSSDVLGYRSLYAAVNPTQYYYLKVFGYGSEPTLPYKFADVILTVNDYPEIGDRSEVRFAKMRSPILQLPFSAEWSNLGQPMQYWVNWYAQDVPWQLWATG